MQQKYSYCFDYVMLSKMLKLVTYVGECLIFSLILPLKQFSNIKAKNGIFFIGELFSCRRKIDSNILKKNLQKVQYLPNTSTKSGELTISGVHKV